jgi:hypothetical protein
MAAEKPEVIIDAAAKVGDLTTMISVSVYYGNMQIQIINRYCITIRCGEVYISEVLSKTSATTAKRRVFIDGYFGTN